MVCTVAPRRAARIASSPHPVPISRTRVPSVTPASSSRRSILRPCASAKSGLWTERVGGCRWALVEWRPGGHGRCRAGVRRGEGGVEEGGRIAQRLVEEEREEVVGQVVVVRDVGLAVGLGAALVARACRGVTKARSRCSELRDERGDPGGGHGEEPGEVVGVPGAGQVGLAEADQAVAAEAGVELVGTVHAHASGRRWPSRAAGGLLDDGHGEPAYGGAEQPAGDGRGDRGAGTGGQRLQGRHALGAQLAGAARRVGSSRGVIARPPGGGGGRGRTGSRRAHSQMPWARISAAAAQGGAEGPADGDVAAGAGEAGAERARTVPSSCPRSVTAMWRRSVGTGTAMSYVPSTPWKGETYIALSVRARPCSSGWTR